MSKFSLATLLTFLCLVGAITAVDVKAAGVRLHQIEYGKLVKNRLQDVRDYKGCVLPPFPKNGKYVIDGSSKTPAPGEIVDDLTILFFSCSSGAIMDGDGISICNDGSWTKEPPTCAVETNCVLPNHPEDGKFEVVGATTQPKPGELVGEFTIIKYKCNILFDLEGDVTSICRSGKWTTISPACQRSNRCLIPEPPVKGSYSIIGSSNYPVAGTEILEHEILKYDCPAPNFLVSDSITICSKGQWVLEIPQCVDYVDCSNVTSKTSGIFPIKFPDTCDHVPIYCELNLLGGKWTLIQQRVDHSVNFYLSYADYAAGFGHPSGNLWLGLDRIHELTKDGNYELYVDLKAFNGITAFAHYTKFQVGNSSTGYKLTIGGFSGTAGDSMVNNNGMKFTTYNKNQGTGTSNCANKFEGAWWYKDCTQSNLNGKYYFSDQTVGDQAIHWFTLFGKQTALKTTRMLIRKTP